jgi:DNA-binding response OmpR family regulator
VSGEGRVLIVEDDADVRGMLGEYLAAHGFEVVLSDCGSVGG